MVLDKFVEVAGGDAWVSLAVFCNYVVSQEKPDMTSTC